jgi:nitrate reductase (NAD(P)H)
MLDSDEAKMMLLKYHIGQLAPGLPPTVDVVAGGENGLLFLQSKSWKKVVLQNTWQPSRNTRMLTLRWDHNNKNFGLPVGKHVLLRVNDPRIGNSITRAYTPVAVRDSLCEVDLLIKIYRKTESERGGKMSMSLDVAPIGSVLEMKGPMGSFEYLGKGRCLVSGQEHEIKRFIMISAGSGITPMFQIVRAIEADADDLTNCLLLYGNRHESDILFKEELDSMASRRPSQLQVIYSLTSPNPSWSGLTGRLGKTILEAVVGQPQPDVGQMILFCGPGPMEQTARGVLLNSGWGSDHIFHF